MTAPQLLTTAIRLAAAAHRDQVDKGGAPYILHPLRVMMACDGDAQIVAILHDVVEDTTVALATIEQLFGTAIAHGVDAMTKRSDESYDDFIDRCMADPLARIVKRADIADNMNRERLDALDFNTRVRLIDKYERALARMDRYTLPPLRITVEQQADGTHAVFQNGGFVKGGWKSHDRTGALSYARDLADAYETDTAQPVERAS